MTEARASAHRARGWLGALLAVILTAAPLAGEAQAQSPVPMRQMLVSWSGHLPALSFSIGGFLDKSLVAKLKSGLPQTIVTRIYAYPEHGGPPITVSAHSCRVVYDLWDGSYRVQVRTERRDQARTVRKLDDVATACFDVKQLVLGADTTFERYRGKRIYFAVLVELNPLSQDTVHRIRRWLAKTGDSKLSGDAFFGSFVSIFVSRKMGSAERTQVFRSRTFTVPP